MIEAGLIQAILEGYRLPLNGVHGPAHWARVYENGRRLAEVTGADLRVVELFAVLHDARRFNEAVDPGHGQRGADLAAELRGRAFELDEASFRRLTEACAGHTEGTGGDDLTVLSCWDADRLDLERVGIWVDPGRLSTQAARDPAVIAWASRRAHQLVVPAETLGGWGIALPGWGE